MLSALFAALDRGSAAPPPADSSHPHGPLAAAEAGRLRNYLAHLQADPAPAQLLWDWAGSHGLMRAWMTTIPTSSCTTRPRGRSRGQRTGLVDLAAHAGSPEDEEVQRLLKANLQD